MDKECEWVSEWEEAEHVCNAPWNLQLKVREDGTTEAYHMKKLGFALKALGRQKGSKQESDVIRFAHSWWEVLKPQLRKLKWEGHISILPGKNWKGKVTDCE